MAKRFVMSYAKYKNRYLLLKFKLIRLTAKSSFWGLCLAQSSPGWLCYHVRWDLSLAPWDTCAPPPKEMQARKQRGNFISQHLLVLKFLFFKE